MEERLNMQYNDLIRRSREGNLSNAEFADEIENKLLPELTSAKARFDSLRTSGAGRKIADKIGEYRQLRAESWQSLVIGLRENNQAAMERYHQQSAAADSVAKQISENAD